MMTHPMLKKENDIGLASLPRTEDGLLDRRKIIHLCAKLNLTLDSLYEIYPFEFVTLVEGKIESDREYYEMMCTAIYSGTAQIMSKKPFKNPFEKRDEKPIGEKHVANKKTQAETFNAMQELFGVTVETDDTEEEY